MSVGDAVFLYLVQKCSEFILKYFNQFEIIFQLAVFCKSVHVFSINSMHFLPTWLHSCKVKLPQILFEC